jgi:hypothetical protein
VRKSGQRTRKASHESRKHERKKNEDKSKEWIRSYKGQVLTGFSGFFSPSLVNSSLKLTRGVFQKELDQIYPPFYPVDPV